MECGIDLAKARREVLEREKRDRASPATNRDALQEAAVGAKAGVGAAGETSAKVRLKTFDRQLAKKLGRERVAVIVTAAIGLIAGIVILAVGLNTIKSAGGFAVVRELSYTDLREQSFGAFENRAFIGSVVTLLGVAGLLCGVGQAIRVITATQAIGAVKRGERPAIVAISNCTRAGLLLASVLAPPLGLVLGIVFKLGHDEETRRLGGKMIWAAVISVGFIGANLIWNLLASMAGSMGTAPSAGSNTASP